MTLSLAANVDLDSTTLLTIHGLTPTATPSSPRVLLAGGYSVDPSAPSGVGSYAFYGDSWTSNDMGLTWLQVSNASASSWTPREGFALAVANASVFLAGGWGGPGQGYLNDVWKSTDVGTTWQVVVASPPWGPRGYFEMVPFPAPDLSLFSPPACCAPDALHASASWIELLFKRRMLFRALSAYLSVTCDNVHPSRLRPTDS